MSEVLDRDGRSLTQAAMSETLLYQKLQQRLGALFSEAPGEAEMTIVVVPSLTLDSGELRKIRGVIHFEERLLFLVQLLRQPRTRIVYVTSRALDPIVIEYALDIVSSLPRSHARKRLTLLNCQDDSPNPLTQKILERPGMIDQIQQSIPDITRAYLVTFNSTALERTMAVRLGVPLYACDPDLAYLGTKSGGRKLFQEAGVPVPAGVEGIRDEHDLISALVELQATCPGLPSAVVKLNESFAGCGNAMFSYRGSPAADLQSWLGGELPKRLSFAVGSETWESYTSKLKEMGGIVECFISTLGTESPSVQLEIDPVGRVNILSTHGQLLGGPAGQSFVGCTFPASQVSNTQIQELAMRAGGTLASKGVIGQLSIDFIVETAEAGGRAYALEVNLRMGGATAPYFVLHGLVEGRYFPDSGQYLTPDGEPRCYVASDRAEHESYYLLDPYSVVDIALQHGLHYSHASRTGVAFYVLGALSDVGKLGMVAIESAPDRARRLYDEMVAVAIKHGANREPMVGR
jgi:hypothetical protein